jgi:NTE family protein
MAIPGIFTPVEWDGRILSDGGLANNLPTDVVKDMGADVIIGVTLRISPTDAQELQSITDILRQSLNIALVQNELRNAPLADIEIAVQLGNRRSLDFSDTESIIELGYQAAAKNASMLEKYSISPEAWEQYRRTLQSRRRTMPPVGPLLGVSTRQPVIQRNAERELARKLGPNVTRDRLENNLSGLTAATGLPSAFYGWHSDGERSGYKVELTPRRNAEVWIRPSFFYQLSEGEAGRPTLRLSTTTIPQNAYKSRLMADVSLGPNPAVVMEYYHPFGGSAYFIAHGPVFGTNPFLCPTPTRSASAPRAIDLQARSTVVSAHGGTCNCAQAPRQDSIGTSMPSTWRVRAARPPAIPYF